MISDCFDPRESDLLYTGCVVEALQLAVEDCCHGVWGVVRSLARVAAIPAYHSSSLEKDLSGTHDPSKNRESGNLKGISYIRDL